MFANQYMEHLRTAVTAVSSKVNNAMTQMWSMGTAALLPVKMKLLNYAVTAWLIAVTEKLVTMLIISMMTVVLPVKKIQDMFV
jgi:hypothetical protein